jgi:hypothetical protein
VGVDAGVVEVDVVLVDTGVVVELETEVSVDIGVLVELETEVSVDIGVLADTEVVSVDAGVLAKEVLDEFTMRLLSRLPITICWPVAVHATSPAAETVHAVPFFLTKL